jgi:hypothetical protein
MNLIQDKGLYTAAKLSAQLQSIADYVVGNNPGVHVTGDNLSNDMNSLKTNQEILSAKILIKAVALKGVPAMLINHRQMIELGSGVGYEDMLPDAIKLLTKPPKS